MSYQFVQASSRYLTTAAAPVTAIPITLACRFNATGITGMTLMSLGATSGDFDRLQMSLSGLAISAFTVSGGSVTSSTSTAATANTWNHAAAVYQTANKQAFLNGVAGTAETTAYGLVDVAQVTVGGRRNSGGFGVFMNGLIAEVGIWSAALTAAEIASLSAGFTPDQVRPQSLVFYAPLVRELRDLRGGLAITATNSPTVATHPRIIQ